MGMTVNQLHKRLGKLIEQGHGRKPVTVAKDTFTHNCEEDGCTILPVDGIGIRWIRQEDGDGGTKENKDGSESMRQNCLLVGDSACNMKGEILDEYLHI